MSLTREYVEGQLERKLQLDSECLAFGVLRHRYQLRPPSKDSDVHSLEATYGIRLPPDYRRFITEIGDGGAGPSCGLYSAKGTLSGKGDVTYGRFQSGGAHRIDEPFVRPNYPKCGGYDECGLLLLCQHGCAHSVFLVVSGSQSGTVWEYSEPHGIVVPLVKNLPIFDWRSMSPAQTQSAQEELVKLSLAAEREEQMTFSDWYAEWLETLPRITPRMRKARTNDRPWWKFW